MAVSVGGKFTIKGDVQGAVRAATEFGKAVTSLNTRLKTFAKNKPQMDAFNKTITSSSVRLTTWTGRALAAAAAAVTLAKAYERLYAAQTKAQGGGTAGTTKTAAPPPAAAVTAPVAAVVSAPATAARASTSLANIATNAARANSQISSTLNVTGLLGAALSKVGQIGSGAFNLVQRAINGVKTGVSNLTGLVSRTFAQFQYFAITVSDSFRMVSLGLTHIASTMLFFVSLPLAGMIYDVGRAVIDFDDQMKRVQKTTGLTTAQMNQLIPAIRALGKTTATPMVQLGEMAEQIGQLGVTSIKSIAELLDISNMLVVATDVTSDEVAIQLGKIANAFHINLNKSTDEIWRLANVLNMLENTTAASAKEILDATFKFAPVASMMNMNAQETMAFGAALTSMGYDASEAGTALRNIGIYLVKNIDKVKDALKAQEKYNTVSKLSAAINKDTTGVIVDYVRALSAEDDIAKKLGITYEQLNLRGGRGAASLAGNLDLLIYNLATANKEYEEADSLMREYDRAMSSTKSQVAVLRNNLTEMGITIGEVVLPVINKLVQFAIPAVQMLAKAFKELNPQTQLLVVAFVGLLTVGGPLMMMLTQMLHGIFWMALGFTNLLKIVPMVVGFFSTLISLVLSFAGAFRGIPLILAAATLGILKVLQKRGVDVAKFFRDLADRALEWGENLAATYSSGLVSGAIRFISRALAWIGNLVANFLAAKSPPKEGPLSNIDKWGQGLMRTFLRSFAAADFSILEDVGNIIQRILSNMFSLKKIGETAQFRFLLDARKYLAELIAAFSETGKVAEDVLSKVVANLGEFKNDVADLIRYWLEYTRIQKELAAIETRRKTLKRIYTDEMKAIALSGKSAEERLAMIRKSTSAYNQENDKLDREQELLEEQEDQAKENLTWQQQFIRALTVQEDIQGRLVEVMERLAKAAENMSGFSFPEPPEDEGFGLTEEQQNAMEALYNLPKRIADAKAALGGLFVGLKGEMVPTELVKTLSPETQADYYSLYNLGVRVRDIWLKVRAVFDGIRGVRISDEEWAKMTPEQQKDYDETYQTFEDIRSIVDSLRDSFDNLGGSIEGAFGKGQGAIGGFFENLIQGFKESPLGQYIGAFLAAIAPAIEPLKHAWADLFKAIGPFITAFMRLVGLIMKTPAFQFLSSTLGQLVGFIWGTVVRAIMFVVSIFLEWISVLLRLGTMIMNFVSDLLSGEGLAKAWENFATSLGQLILDIIGFFSTFFGEHADEIKQTAQDLLTGFIEGLMEKKDDVGKKIGEIWQSIVDGIKTFFGISSPSSLMKGYAHDMVQGLIDGWVEWWDKLLTTVDEKIQAFKDKLNGYIDAFKTIGYNIANGLREGFVNLLEKLLGKNAPDAFKSFIRSILNMFQIGSPSRLFKRIGLGVGKGFHGGLDEANRGLAGLRSAIQVRLPTATTGFGASVMAPALAPAYATSFGTGGGTYELHLHLHNPVVRDEQDIKKIARAVKKELDGDTTFANRFHGSTMT